MDLGWLYFKSIEVQHGAIFDRGKGLYVLWMFNEQDPVGDWRGANKYSLRVSSAAAVQPPIYGIGDVVMSATRTT